MANNTAPRRSCLRRVLSFMLFGLIPLLLVVAIGWSGYRVMDAFVTRYNDYSEIESRRMAYDSTATAIAQSPEADAEVRAGNIRMVAQFATNTPVADDGSGDAPVNGGLVTNTPQVTSTSIPQPTVAAPTVAATPIPATQVPPEQRTPVPLPTFYPPASSDLAEIAGTAVPTKVPVIPRDYELVNIVLLGGDDELVEDNTIRTDTMIIVSVNTETGTVSMLSLPRDLFVYVPTPTMQRLNTVYGIGEAFGWSGGGFGLLRETIFYNFGIQVHYYARVNFTGFEQIIDALGGVEIAVDCTYQDYYPVAPIEELDLTRPLEENYKLRTLPVGYYEMDGFDALWYARTRKNADDFDRGRRQQQLLRAILRAAIDNGQLAQLPSLWSQLTEVVETDVPFDVVLGLLPIALELDPGRIENFTLVRTYHTQPWQPPSGALAGQYVQLPNYEPIRQLLEDFYQPPTQSQIALAGPSIAVYNGTANADWDRVASERLRSEGLNAYAAGPAEQTNYADTVLIDQVGEDKGSPVSAIVGALNMAGGNVQIQPDPNRTADYRVIVGQNYNSCTANVLPVQ